MSLASPGVRVRLLLGSLVHHLGDALRQRPEGGDRAPAGLRAEVLVLVGAALGRLEVIRLARVVVAFVAYITLALRLDVHAAVETPVAAALGSGRLRWIEVVVDIMGVDLDLAEHQRMALGATIFIFLSVVVGVFIQVAKEL